MTRRDCPRCQGQMAKGLMIENKDGMACATKWLEGAGEKGWFGLKLKGRKQLPVVTYRCGRCGFLESYAPD